MAKVGSMTRQRIVLIASVLLLTAGATNASWRHKTDRPTEASVPAGMTLTAIEFESAPTARLLLRTSGTPAYTSYSPAPDTFVIDLSNAAKAPSLTLPASIPGVTSVGAEEVTEMGARLTRVTVHLAQPSTLQAVADDHAVAVTLPAKEEPLPAVTPVATAAVIADPPKAEPKAEPVAEAVKPPVEEPVVKAEPIPAAKAKTLKSVSTTGSGAAMSVQLAADGDVAFNAFPLEKPSRLVIDLNGVTDKVAKGTVNVGGPLVKKIRVAQFKGGAEPVTRVVLDLAAKSAYQVTKDGDRLVVTFGGESVAETPKPVEVKKAEQTPPPAPPAPAASKPAALTAQVPVIAEPVPEKAPETKAEWKMPEKKLATGVIRAPKQTAAPKPSTKKTTAAPQPQPPPAAPAAAGRGRRLHRRAAGPADARGRAAAGQPPARPGAANAQHRGRRRAHAHRGREGLHRRADLAEPQGRRSEGRDPHVRQSDGVEHRRRSGRGRLRDRRLQRRAVGPGPRHHPPPEQPRLRARGQRHARRHALAPGRRSGGHAQARRGRAAQRAAAHSQLQALLRARLRRGGAPGRRGLGAGQDHRRHAHQPAHHQRDPQLSGDHARAHRLRRRADAPGHHRGPHRRDDEDLPPAVRLPGGLPQPSRSVARHRHGAGVPEPRRRRRRPVRLRPRQSGDDVPHGQRPRHVHARPRAERGGERRSHARRLRAARADAGQRLGRDPERLPDSVSDARELHHDRRLRRRHAAPLGDAADHRGGHDHHGHQRPEERAGHRSGGRRRGGHAAVDAHRAHEADGARRRHGRHRRHLSDEGKQRPDAPAVPAPDPHHRQPVQDP